MRSSGQSRWACCASKARAGGEIHHFVAVRDTTLARPALHHVEIVSAAHWPRAATGAGRILSPEAGAGRASCLRVPPLPGAPEGGLTGSRDKRSQKRACGLVRTPSQNRLRSPFMTATTSPEDSNKTASPGRFARGRFARRPLRGDTPTDTLCPRYPQCQSKPVPA